MSPETFTIKPQNPKDVADARTELILAVALANRVLIANGLKPKTVFVGYVNDVPIGMSEVATLSSSKKDVPNEMGEITYYVHPQYQGNGYGKQLIDTAIKCVEEEWQLPVCARVAPNSLSQWLLRIRKFRDISDVYFADLRAHNISYHNRFLLRQEK